MKTCINILFIILIFTLSSCEKQDDFSKISKNYHYQGDWAIAAGISTLNLQNVKNGNIDTILKYPGLFKSISFRDTLPFDMSNFAVDSKYIKNFVLNIRIQNEFPVDGKLNLYLGNTFTTIIDTLIENIIIKHADISGDSTISSPYLIEPIEVSREQIAQWQSVRFIFLYISLDNSDQLQHGNFWNYNLTTEVGARFQLDFNVKDVMK